MPGRQVGLAAPQFATSLAAVVVRLTQGLPLFTPLKQMAVLKAPCAVVTCGAQKSPVQLPVPAPVQHAYGAPAPVHDAAFRLVKLDVPVVSGLRLIAMFPMNCAQRPPGQSLPVEQVAPLLVPR